jgi:hypothetical protein
MTDKIELRKKPRRYAARYKVLELVESFSPVIASEAKQSRLSCSKLDCFVASLLAMTSRV